MPVLSLPTSDSSTTPLKIMSSMLATEAMVVPSLKVLVSITELPTSTGTSSTVPPIVERTRVLVEPPVEREMPFSISARLSRAASISACALR
jgi:hypothetical protein